jgi:hypothetical protein
VLRLLLCIVIYVQQLTRRCDKCFALIAFLVFPLGADHMFGTVAKRNMMDTNVVRILPSARILRQNFEDAMDFVRSETLKPFSTAGVVDEKAEEEQDMIADECRRRMVICIQAEYRRILLELNGSLLNFAKPLVEMLISTFGIDDDPTLPGPFYVFSVHYRDGNTWTDNLPTVDELLVAAATHERELLDKVKEPKIWPTNTPSAILLAYLKPLTTASETVMTTEQNGFRWDSIVMGHLLI